MLKNKVISLYSSLILNYVNILSSVSSILRTTSGAAWPSQSTHKSFNTALNLYF